MKKIRLRYLNNNGSSTVFLVMVLSSMVLITFAFIQVTIRVSGDSAGQSVALLSARSVLTEYDKNLKNEYGLFAFRGESRLLSTKLEYYMDPFYDDNPYYHFIDTNVNVSNHRLSKPSVFEDSIAEYMIYASSKDLIDLVIDSDVGIDNEDVIIPAYPVGRVLRNHQIIENLPSFSVGESHNLIETVKSGLSDWKSVFRNTSKNFLVNRYIMMHYKNAQNDLPDYNTFFNYEAEYILKGNFDDEENKSLFRRDLVLLRNAINLSTIYSNTQMREQVITAANLITPGPESLVTQIIIAEAWALAEAENDMRILEHGKVVPIQKTSETWAIDIQSVIEKTESGYIDTNAKSGLDYQGYLQIFLFFENKTIKLSRMMDLIQINIQGNFDRTFLINEHQVGLEYETNINYFTIHGSTQY